MIALALWLIGFVVVVVLLAPVAVIVILASVGGITRLLTGCREVAVGVARWSYRRLARSGTP